MIAGTATRSATLAAASNAANRTRGERSLKLAIMHGGTLRASPERPATRWARIRTAWMRFVSEAASLDSTSRVQSASPAGSSAAIRPSVQRSQVCRASRPGSLIAAAASSVISRCVAAACESPPEARRKSSSCAATRIATIGESKSTATSATDRVSTAGRAASFATAVASDGPPSALIRNTRPSVLSPFQP